MSYLIDKALSFYKSVKLIEAIKIYEEIITKMNFDEFKIWFNDLISKSF